MISSLNMALSVMIVIAVFFIANIVDEGFFKDRSKKFFFFLTLEAFGILFFTSFVLRAVFGI